MSNQTFFYAIPLICVSKTVNVLDNRFDDNPHCTSILKSSMLFQQAEIPGRYGIRADAWLEHYSGV